MDKNIHKQQTFKVTSIPQVKPLVSGRTPCGPDPMTSPQGVQPIRDMAESINIDLEMERLEMELHNRDRINSIYDQLGHMYDQVIWSYKKRKMLVYNPNIFKTMTKAIFIDWVIDNNPELKKEINHLTHSTFNV